MENDSGQAGMTEEMLCARGASQLLKSNVTAYEQKPYKIKRPLGEVEFLVRPEKKPGGIRSVNTAGSPEINKRKASNEVFGDFPVVSETTIGPVVNNPAEPHIIS
jgi:hypothetical protein